MSAAKVTGEGEVIWMRGKVQSIWIFVSNLVRLPAYEWVPDGQPKREFHFYFDYSFGAMMESVAIDLCPKQRHLLRHSHHHHY